uniref:Gfo/Idh/MocA-like oxidoreductase domain containing 1 n=1 Tax=Equus caballus TaxID=9796 RepID=A0A9L0RUB8_HORSE
MLPGVGVFGTSLTARVIIPLLKDEGFAVKALWGRTPEEAEELAKEMSVPFYTSRIDEVLLHQDVDLVCINLPPPLTRQIAVKTLGSLSHPQLSEILTTKPSLSSAFSSCTRASPKKIPSGAGPAQQERMLISYIQPGLCCLGLPGSGLRFVLDLLSHQLYILAAGPSSCGMQDVAST